jgi:outer membrane receptor protein involved in Fe transport
MSYRILLLASSSLAVFVPTAVYAQAETPQTTASDVQAPESNDGIAEIVVTAQKRAQNVQDVPIAITALTASALKERAVADVASLSNIAPNVTLDAGTPFSGSSSVLSAYIRGIGQNDFAANLDPGVGVYLDGVYLARTVGANLDLPDVERIEILKGPQGTLFGRNTIGGAISIVTRDPGDEFSFRGDITTGRYNRLDINASADLPLTETLGVSITGSSRKRDGYLTRVPFPGAAQFVNDDDAAFRSNGYDRSAKEGGQSEWSLRGKLKWEPTDRLTFRVSGDYLSQDQQGTANKLLGVTSDQPFVFAPTADRALVIPGLGATALYDGNSGLAPNGFNFAGLYNFCIGSTAAQISARNATALCGSRGTPLNPDQVLGGLASANVDGNPNNNRLPFDTRFLLADKDKSYATGLNFSRMRTWGVSATLDYELTDWLNIKSITGYRDLKWGTGLDADGSPIRALEFSFSLDNWQFSQEIQLSGQALNDKLKYVFGGYYFKERSFLQDYVTFDQGVLQIFGPNLLNTKNYAFFGQVDYEISDLISVTLGGRYTNEKKNFNGGQSDLNGFNYKLFNCPVFGDPCTTALGFPSPTEPLRYYVPATQYRKFNNFSPKVGVQLHPTDDIMIYGSWSKGYKTGGWTTRLSNPLTIAASFDPEEAESYELGVKSQLFDRHLQINAAVFTTKYSGIQLNFQQGVSPTIQNAGDARIKGFEVEIVAAPANGLTINTSVGYTDASYTSVLPAAQVAPNSLQAGVFAGAPLPKTPKWKFNVSPRYEYILGNGGALVALVDFTRSSEVWNDTERAFLLRRAATSQLNASLTYRAPEEKWDVTVGGVNLTNDRYLVSGGNQTAAGLLFGSYNRPTEWYARLGVKF